MHNDFTCLNKKDEWNLSIKTLLMHNDFTCLNKKDEV